MLSILIPVYNFNIVDLVTELHRQATEANIPFEILVADDCSQDSVKQQNRVISELPHVTYIEESKNLGRSCIRNKLFSISSYEYIIFMDCDAGIKQQDYIKQYLNQCNGSVVCGGTAYQDKEPERDYFLRWIYGKNREQRAADERNHCPNNSFTTFNFLVPRAVFEQINFDESLSRYGHEDTLFGYELKKNNHVVKHIDNPLIHLGLDENKDFVFKTKQSVKNLFFIATTNKQVEADLFKDIKVLSYYRQIQRMGIVGIVSLLYKIFHKQIEANLTGSHPKLAFLDLLKIGYLCTLKK